MQNLELREAIKFFSARFHRDAPLGDETNYICSPLGAWILLAQVAGGNSAALSLEETEKIENTLGTTIPAAYNYANFLIKSAPPVIKAASAAWFSSKWSVGEIGATWIVNTEQEEVTDISHQIPSKLELNEWARKNTLGIISEFPFTPDRDTVMILANALATKIQWAEPFGEIKNDMTSMWMTKKLLFSDENQHTKQFFADEEGNLFAVLTAEGSGISVHAVIADNPDLPEHKVLSIAESYAAGEVFTLVAPDTLASEGNVFVVSDAVSSTGDLFSAKLPAWDAEKSHNLLDFGLPYIEASKAISGNADYKVESIQVAKASYNKLGFEAAAISALMMRATGIRRNLPVKRVEINFNHPFAVVAAHSPIYRSPNDTAELWDNLPVFSAWVVTASEVEDK